MPPLPSITVPARIVMGCGLGCWANAVAVAPTSKAAAIAIANRLCIEASLRERKLVSGRRGPPLTDGGILPAVTMGSNARVRLLAHRGEHARQQRHGIGGCAARLHDRRNAQVLLDRAEGCR